MTTANVVAMNRPPSFKFRLYIAGGTQNAAAALANLDALCRAHLPERHEIEVVDVFLDPASALADAVFMTPTLVKRWPLPVRKIIGTLSQPATVLQALGLPLPVP
jgi:circadian clock protein KaiB